MAFALAQNAVAQSTISAGGNHTLVVKSDGTVYAFGYNSNGQLGDGTRTDHPWPLQVPNLSGIQAVAAGGWHSLALTTDGTVKAWGKNYFGELGDSTTIDRWTPISVPLTGVVAIAAGEYHSLALTSDGKVYAWGWNTAGQVTNPASNNVQTPTLVFSGGVVAIAAGYSHSLAVKSDGTVWAWGGNISGQLGNGTTSIGATPTPAQVLNVSGAIAAAGGDGHSLFLLSDGTVKSVGENADGQLGDTHTADQYTAVAVVSLTNVTKISAGSYLSLGLIRFGGHLPKGGYDVRNGRCKGPAPPPAVHG